MMSENKITRAVLKLWGRHTFQPGSFVEGVLWRGPQLHRQIALCYSSVEIIHSYVQVLLLSLPEKVEHIQTLCILPQYVRISCKLTW